MIGKIQNARDRKISDNVGSMPYMAQSIQQIMQPVQVGIIKSQMIGGYNQTVVEKYVKVLSVRIENPNHLVMTKTGERIWVSMDIYFTPDVILQPDDLFIYRGKQYRVIVTEEWSDYGYSKYGVIEDYTKLFTKKPDVIE